MNKILLLSLFLLGGVYAYAAQIIRGPYIEDPTQTTMIVKWQTDEATPAWLEYGPSPRCNQIMTVTPEGTQHKAILYGLVPNQDFCYRIYVNNSAKDGVQEPVTGTFRTLYSAERKVVNFLALGATGEDIPLPSPDGLPVPDEAAMARAGLAALMEQEESDFLIHTGNITHSGLNQDADREFFEPFKNVLSKNPLFVALGPNEYGPDREQRESKSFLRTNYSRYHDMTWSKATPKYYSFDTANARFIFLDTNVAEGAVWAPEIGEKSAQTEWLKSTLATAGEKWKIVVMNAPAYSTGARGSNNEVALNWVKIFEDYRVKLVIQGGDADYERTFPMYRGEPNARGVTYVTLGTAAPAPGKRQHSDASTARFVSTRHYASGKIVDRKLTLKVYSDKGKQLDTLEIYL
ncbi:metallophosphoesterase [Candidatus Avelusimicrobium alvi]|uniref:metallophosphoesterase n=1 Tax=Candidatus Avelusimicrobium alvi TaxID=3416221 RepID=UPI003D0A3F20